MNQACSKYSPINLLYKIVKAGINFLESEGLYRQLDPASSCLLSVTKESNRNLQHFIFPRVNVEVSFNSLLEESNGGTTPTIRTESSVDSYAISWLCSTQTKMQKLRKLSSAQKHCLCQCILHSEFSVYILHPIYIKSHSS